MITIHRLILICVASCLLIVTTQAQNTPIEIGMAIEGQLDSSATHVYTWSALEATVVSIKVTVADSSLDPTLRILDSSGTVIVANDDFNYPDDVSAVVQAFVVPRTDTYTIEVSAFGDTSGAYTLSILRGYDRLATQDVRVATANWSTSQNRIFTTTPVNDNLYVESEGISVAGTLIANHFPQHENFYYEVSFREITATTVWQVGIIFRYVNPTSYYRLMMNDQGFWRLEYVGDEAVTVIQSWSTHPVIVAGVPEFTLGVLTSDATINVVYNGQIIGTVYDETITTAGAVGATSITANALNSRVAFTIESALLTIPSVIQDQLQFPQMLIGQNLNAYTSLLERQQVIPIGGELRFTSPETVIRNVEPGVSRFPIASSVEFREFVIAGELTITTLGEGIGGCGLTFNETEENHYTLAYVNIADEYGVSQRDGDLFESGIYGTQALPQGSTAHEIVLVVLDGTLYLYMDSMHVGTMLYNPEFGGIGTAVVNFDGVDTTCTIDDLWLWSLDDIES